MHSIGRSRALKLCLDGFFLKCQPLTWSAPVFEVGALARSDRDIASRDTNHRSLIGDGTFLKRTLLNVLKHCAHLFLDCFGGVFVMCGRYDSQYDPYGGV